MTLISLITATHNRPQELGSIALPSLLAQTTSDFEWVVVNDGVDEATRDLISSLKTHFQIVYLETPHVGLGEARNLGLQSASGEVVSYLDDDNSLVPQFIESTVRFFAQNPTIKYSMCRQLRRRDVVQNGQLVKTGKPFMSPDINCQIEELLLMRQLFDSNGFAHYRLEAPEWNSQLKVFVDYEYLLQCASIWGESKFQLNSSVGVNYTQTNQGIIGKSSYKEWSEELQFISDRREQYGIFKSLDSEFLLELIGRYRHQKEALISAFS
jgi:glycosyltransferase involved in cell wall biosynthesis